VEVMIATVLLSMIILSILAVLIGSYRVAAKARYNDHARFVIKSLADQFLTQQTTDGFGNTLPLFQGTSATGLGLSWTTLQGSTLSGTAAGLQVVLGENTGSPITASVTRSVWYVYDNPANPLTIGQPTSVPQNGSAGYLLRGDFTISYSFLGTALPPLTVSAIRSVP